MALTATIYKVEIALSDVDRGVYQTLDLRLARHPSETMRYLLTRTLAYCLCWEEGIAFSKGGLSDTDEPPVSVRSLDGRLLAWIDVGSPSADRLHKAAKAAPKVTLFTSANASLIRDEARARGVHKGASIEVVEIDPAFLDGIELDKSTKIELTRTEGTLYVTIDGTTTSTALTTAPLL